MQESAKTLLATITDILDLNRIQSGQLRISKGPVSLTALMNKVGSNATGLLKRKGSSLQLHQTRDPSVTEFIETDEGRMLQVLFNLMSNAIKFTDEGFVEYGVRIVPPTSPPPLPPDAHAHAPHQFLQFYVKDTGRGISEQFRRRIFRPFAQEDDSPNRKYGGTGIGLSVCQQLASLMGGGLTFDSELGKGSTFYLTVPYSPLYMFSTPLSAQKSEPVDSPLSCAGSNSESRLPIGKILVVDDDTPSRKLVERILTKVGRVTVSFSFLFSPYLHLPFTRANRNDTPMQSMHTRTHTQQVTQSLLAANPISNQSTCFLTSIISESVLPFILSLPSTILAYSCSTPSVSLASPSFLSPAVCVCPVLSLSPGRLLRGECRGRSASCRQVPIAHVRYLSHTHGHADARAQRHRGHRGHPAAAD